MSPLFSPDQRAALLALEGCLRPLWEKAQGTNVPPTRLLAGLTPEHSWLDARLFAKSAHAALIEHTILVEMHPLAEAMWAALSTTFPPDAALLSQTLLLYPNEGSPYWEAAIAITHPDAHGVARIARRTHGPGIAALLEDLGQQLHQHTTRPAPAKGHARAPLPRSP